LIKQQGGSVSIASMAPGDQLHHQKQGDNKEWNFDKNKDWVQNGSGGGGGSDSDRADTHSVNALVSSAAEVEEVNMKPLLPPLIQGSQIQGVHSGLALQLKTHRHSPSSIDDNQLRHHRPTHQDIMTSSWAGTNMGGAYGVPDTLLQHGLQPSQSSLDLYNGGCYGICQSTGSTVRNDGLAPTAATGYAPWYIQHHSQHHHSSTGQMT